MDVLPRWVTVVYAGAAAALLPWTAVLMVTLPQTTQVHNWSLAWAGLDILIAAAAAGTAWLAWRRDPRVALAATATGTLLLADAWFDVTTAAAGGDRALALALALALELPLAGLCAVVAWRASGGVARTPGRSRRRPRFDRLRDRAFAAAGRAVRLMDHPLPRAGILIGAFYYDLAVVHDASTGVIRQDTGALILALAWLSPWHLLVRPAINRLTGARAGLAG